MSSTWNQHDNGNSPLPAAHGRAGAAIHDRGTGRVDGTDEWDLLRSSPDFDMEEMQGVSMPAVFPQPAVWPAPVVSPAPWSAPAPDAPAPAAPEPVWQSSAPDADPAGGWSPPATPAVRWPEAAGVAHLASDLLADAQGEGLWRAMELPAGDGIFGTSPEGDEDAPAAWMALLARDDVLESETEGLDPSASWAFLPDAMLQRGDGGRDLLNEALQAGERAGLLDAGARLEAGEPAPAPEEATPEGLPDLLDAALKAGERAGLLGR
jgi:hypothetical protein